ncbi:MAG: hypothetical protein ACSLEN_02970 [Candidatus Malihini olakiniferum]
MTHYDEIPYPSTPSETVKVRPDATFSQSDVTSRDVARRDNAGNGRVLGGLAIVITLLLSGGCTTSDNSRRSKTPHPWHS